MIIYNKKHTKKKFLDWYYKHFNLLDENSEEMNYKKLSEKLDSSIYNTEILESKDESQLETSFDFTLPFSLITEEIKTQECSQCLNQVDYLKFKTCVSCKQEICMDCNLKNFFKCPFCRRHVSSGMVMERPSTNIGWDD